MRARSSEGASWAPSEASPKNKVAPAEPALEPLLPERAARGFRLAATLALLALALAGATRPDHVFRQGRFEDRAYRLYVPRSLVAAPTATRRRTQTQPKPEAPPKSETPAPSQAPPPRPEALVVALHGCWQTVEDFATGTQLNEAAERRRLAVLYPVQSPRDNVSRCWNWFEPADGTAGRETHQLLRLISALPHEEGIEAPRVVVLGFSAGAYMAVDLACAAPEVVQGVGVGAGGPYGCGVGLEGGLQCMRGLGLDPARSAAACRAAMRPRAHAVRASLWQGDSDSVVHPSSLDALAAMFAQLAEATPAAPESVSGAKRTVYRDGRGRPFVEAWLVAGMGHAWSGGSARGSQTFPPGPRATERMLDFLLAPP